MSFVQDAEAKMRQTAIDDLTRLNSNYDSFTELSPLSLNVARQDIKNLFVNNPKVLVIVGPLTLSMTVGQTAQVDVLLYDQYYKGPAYTPTSLGRNLTLTAAWLLNPSISTVVTVSEGKITAAVAGTVQVYAKVGDFVSNSITVTVA
jgi:hypothetical protein